MYLYMYVFFLEHVRSMNENTVSASPVYFGKKPPGETSPNGPASVSLRHIVDAASFTLISSSFDFFYFFYV